MKIRLAVLLTALVISATVLGQATLGNMVKLGSSTTVSLPTSSTTIEGAVIYDTDTNTPKFNDGTAWQPFTPPSTDFSWVDAGIQGTRIYIRPDSTNNKSLWFGLATAAPVPVYNNSRIQMDAVDAISWNTNATESQTIHGGTSEMVFDAFGTATTTYRFRRQNATTASYVEAGHYSAISLSGEDAVKIYTAGGRLHLSNGGVSDYLASDGTGTETPSYFEATDYVQGATGFCSGTACAGTAFASFPAAAGLTGRQRYDSTNNVWRWSGGTEWHPVASGFSMAGQGGTGVAELNNVAVLGVGYSSAPSVVSRLSCRWFGSTSDGGTNNMVVELGGTAPGTGLCSCTLGTCEAPSTQLMGTCACTASIPAGTEVLLTYRTVLYDGGIGSECLTNPTEMHCNTN
jgi:hypothetical protein